ncbi:MAG: pentapeptide repeat-containing protein [Thermomicrobiales bacterium]
MDPSQFDRLTRVFSQRASRRGAFGLIIGGLLKQVLPLSGLAHHKHHDRNKADRQRDRDRDKDGSRQSGGTGERHGRDPEAKTRAKRRATDIPRVALSCCSDDNCAPGPKKTLKHCCYKGRNLAGANFNQSNLANASFAGANLRNANFNGANLNKVCFVDANLTGANLNGANLTDVIYCRTTMPNGSTNTSGCGNGSACCPTCDAQHPCGSGKVCCDGKCFSGDCCTNADCGSSGNRCASHVCKCGSGATCAAPTPLCCGSGTDAKCQACCTNDQCPPARPYCHNGQCAGCRTNGDCTQPAEPCREAICAADGTCQTRDKANGASCDDGDKCTRGDTCQNGRCVGSNPVVCPDPDQCHERGTCDPGTGECAYPAKENGAPCDDGNQCTVDDACRNGVCVGGAAVVCPDPDQCHRRGECNPTTGDCTNPAKDDGSPCDDDNPCTINDTCQGGACRGGDPVICPEPDECYERGVCDPADGSCAYAPKEAGTPCTFDGAVPQCRTAVCGGGADAGKCILVDKTNGASCNDGDACTRTDTCQNGHCVGGNPVVCPDPDQCHERGTCNPATGNCSNPTKQNGTICDDGNKCTRTDTCQDGVCRGGNPVTCPPLDPCHEAGTCDPATGVCSNPPRPNGSPCSDGNQCTRTDTCQNGTCVGGNPVICTALDQCHAVGICNPATGVCSNPLKPNDTPCDDGNKCTVGDTCQAGVCTSGAAVTCTPLDQCHAAGTCDPDTGVCSNPTKPNGASCDDGDQCTIGDTCQDGTCQSGAAVVCSPLDQCHAAGACDPATGECSHPQKADGSPCDDQDACTRTDTCQAGVCTGGNPVVCQPLDACHLAGVCDSATGDCSDPLAPDGPNDDCPGAGCCNGVCCTGDQDACIGGECVCQPKTCEDFPGECGAISNGCNQTLQCTCADGCCDIPDGEDRGTCAAVSDTTCGPNGGICLACDTEHGFHCVSDACACDAGFHDCTGVCVSSSDPAHCGTRCTPCPTPDHATATCDGAACGFTCEGNWGNCDGDPANGCETDLLITANHCGTCDTVCPQGATCEAGTCVCPPATPDVCHDECVDLASDERYCGNCDTACAADETCLAGSCCPNARICGATCLTAPCEEASTACLNSACDPATGACVTTAINETGTCGEGDAAGVCCAGDCIAGGECCPGSDPAATGCPPEGEPLALICTAAHQCVQCEVAGTCPAGEICQAATCDAGTCGLADLNDTQAEGCNAEGFSCCTGTCVDTRTDPAHCGDCATACAAPPANAAATCVNGTCGFACNTGYHECNGACVSNTDNCYGPGGCLSPDPNHPDGTDGLKTAITNAAADATITLCPGTWTVRNTPPSPPVPIIENLTLVGAGASGANASVLQIKGGGYLLRIGSAETSPQPTVALRDLKVTRATSSSNGGGIQNFGTLTMERCAITNSVIQGVAPNLATGGGLSNRPGARATLTDCAVTGNRVDGAGGGIFTAGEMELVNTEVTGNTATERNGGGIAIGAGGAATLTDSSVSGNTAGGAGGGIANGTSATLLLEGTSVTDNTATGGNGGGIVSFGPATIGPSPSGPSRIQGNQSSASGDGIFSNTGGAMTLQSGTIVCGNGAAGDLQCDAGFGGTISGACPNPTDGVCCGTGFVACGGICVDTQTDPNHCGDCATVCPVGAPTCQGGACVCPGNGSTACGPGLTCCGNGCSDLNSDPTNCGSCGNSCTGATPVCNGTGSCACGDVCPSGCRFTTIAAAITALPAGSTIRLCAGTYAERITITKNNLTLVGAGSGTGGTVVDGTGLGGRVVTVNSGVTTTLRDLAVTGGQANTGGGISNSGTLTLEGVAVTNNAANTFGGGIHNDGTLILGDGARVTNNTAGSAGAGIRNGGGTATLRAGSSVTGNTSQGDGGGISNAFDGVVSLTLESGSVVAGNTASLSGGGILLSTMTTATLHAGSVVENNRANQGGGVGNRGTLLVAGEIRNNRASTGGGLYNVNSGGPATATLQAGARVTGNTATTVGGGVYEASGTVTLADAAIVTGNTPNNCRPVGAVPICVD